MEQQKANKPSGIPKASRLPVLSKRSTQIFDIGTAKVPAAEPNSRLQKRSSIACLGRSSNSGPLTTGAGTPFATSPIAARPGSIVNGVQTSLEKRAAAHSKPTGGMLKSRTTSSQRRQLSVSAAKSPGPAVNNEDNHDKLGSPEGSRPGSRRRSHSPDSSPIEAEDSCEAANGRWEPGPKKASRPSLSDRTMESISNLPTTPATDRRRSSFFNPMGSPMGPPPRPGSSSSRTDSNGASRPGTSESSFSRADSPSKSTQRQSVSAKPAARSSLGFGLGAQSVGRRSVSSAFATNLDVPCESSEVGALPSSSVRSRSQSPAKRASTNGLRAPQLVKKERSRQNMRAVSSAKEATAGADSQKVQKMDLQNNPNSGNTSKQRLAHKGNVRNGTAITSKASNGSAMGKTSKTQPAVAPKGSAPNATTSSSAALRQQIAAARAAAKKDKVKADSPMSPSFSTSTTNTAPESHLEDPLDDPFNQAPKDGKHILRSRIKSARMDGRLNIAALSLKEIPVDVLEMYTSKAMEESKVNWAEVVDITRFIAADNELETIAESVFPDKTIEELEADSDDGAGNQFGGLEFLDLHRNTLSCVPMGLRRLERLTCLNLAYNKLDNSALETISQLNTLKELKLGHNNLSNSFPSSMCALASLQTLDLQSNRLLGLPEALRELVSLKTLNVSDNQLTNLPMDAIQSLRLSELDASSNALIGSLFPLGGEASHKTLRTLNVAHNSLAALAFTEQVELPEIQEVNVTNNHLTVLPPLVNWTKLRTLMAGENKILEIPAGFAGLLQLRNVNFMGNDIRLVSPEIGRMECLTELVLAGNPLQQKKYLTMSGEDIKRDLKAKLDPIEYEDAHAEGGAVLEDTQADGGPTVGRARSSTAIMWTLRSGGILDLASKGLSDDINDSLGSFLKSNEVRQLLIQQNRLASIPPALWLGQDVRILDLSGNALGAVYLSDDLELPALHELNLSQCRLGSLEPLTTSLKAPKLETLTVTANRLSGPLPTLRRAYPSLVTLFAGDNKFSSICAEALRGLQRVNLTNNEIQALPAEVGLLWDQGLRAFELGGNAFRVPSYTVLEKGTEAVMRWLQNKLPASQHIKTAAEEEF